MNWRERKAGRMAAREQRGYPKIMGGVAGVGDDAWLSQPAAAAELGIAVIRIGVLIACEHLTPAENQAGHAGVTRVSVAAEHHWRQTASLRAKLTRLAKDTIGFL
ncbi:DNA-binding protein [Streptacidiphilus sp. PAMC 29251]